MLVNEYTVNVYGYVHVCLYMNIQSMCMGTHVLIFEYTVSVKGYMCACK